MIATRGVVFDSIKLGWELSITSVGTIIFRQKMADGSTWKIEASGFYIVGDLVLGSTKYSGGNTSLSGEFRLRAINSGHLHCAVKLKKIVNRWYGYFI